MSSPLDTPLLHRVHNQFVEGRKHHPNIEPRGIDRYMFVNQCGGVAGGGGELNLLRGPIYAQVVRAHMQFGARADLI